MVIPTSTLQLSWTAFLNLPLSRNLDSCYNSTLKIFRLVLKKKKKAKKKLMTNFLNLGL